MGIGLCSGEIVHRALLSKMQCGVCVHTKAGILVALCCPHVMMDLVIASSERD